MMLGHNKGPSMEPGQGFRRYAWGKARADLLPQLPLNVIKRRVAILSVFCSRPTRCAYIWPIRKCPKPGPIN